MALVEILRNDKEIIELRAEWEEKMSTPFPPYNYDEYYGIEDYKKKIRQRMKHSNK